MSTDLNNLLTGKQNSWFVTGVAGFIGSNLLEKLLQNNQKVVGIDNFLTGSRKNLEEVKNKCQKTWGNFTFKEGSIEDMVTCQQLSKDCDYIVHLAANGSVQLSVDNPLLNDRINCSGFLHVLEVARTNKIKKLIFASSSAVFGDVTDVPSREENIGEAISPYGLSKYINELYAKMYARTYGINSIGLRFFNVFGPRQDPMGPYAAVIPIWVKQLLKNEEVVIYGDGTTTRDFCFVDNIVYAIVLAAHSKAEGSDVFNVGCEQETSLNQLFDVLRKNLAEMNIPNLPVKPTFKDFRLGDIKRSVASIQKISKKLSYKPQIYIDDGITKCIHWYYENLTRST